MNKLNAFRVPFEVVTGAEAAAGLAERFFAFDVPRRVKFFQISCENWTKGWQRAVVVYFANRQDKEAGTNSIVLWKAHQAANIINVPDMPRELELFSLGFFFYNPTAADVLFGYLQYEMVT